MDLRLYFRAIWRFRVLVGVGLLLATALAFLSVVRVDREGTSVRLKHRGSEIWESRATVLVTERHFPLGRSVFEELILPTSSSNVPRTVAPPNAPSTRFTELANIYAALATSDPVEGLVRRDGPLGGTISAIALKAANGSDVALPMVSIAAHAPTSRGAMILAMRVANGLRTYIELQQRSNGIPIDQRVVLATLQAPGPSTTMLLTGRSKTVPIVVFMTVMLGFVGLAFILDNLRPRIRPLVAEPARTAEDVQARRPA